MGITVDDVGVAAAADRHIVSYVIALGYGNARTDFEGVALTEKEDTVGVDLPVDIFDGGIAADCPSL